MKDLKGVIEDLRAWKADGGIGRFIAMVRPDQSCTTAVEQVVKMRELPDKVQETIRNLITYTHAMRLTIIVGKDGPDRVEIFRLR